MSSSIRGHQTAIKIFKNGAPVSTIPIMKFSVNQESSFSRSFYVGQVYGEGDQTQDGWSGSFDCEVKGPEVDTLIDSIILGKLNGIGADEISILDTEFYPDGTKASYLYMDIQMKMGKNQGGQGEKVSKKLDFQAALRKKV